MIFRREGRQGQDGVVRLAAHTALIAAGTSPNVIYEKEYRGTFQLDAKKKFFQPHRVVFGPDGVATLEADEQGFFTSYDVDGRFVTYYGDNHPRYAGNVVKAMASAKHGFPKIVSLFAREIAALDPEAQASRDAMWSSLVQRMDDDLL